MGTTFDYVLIEERVKTMGLGVIRHGDVAIVGVMKHYISATREITEKLGVGEAKLYLAKTMEP